MIDGALHIFDRMVDTDPFVSNISYMEGALTRLSTAALLNVTAGGGSQVPLFVVERR
jgi:tRNA G26 N,N-dimethylase Trm1